MTQREPGRERPTRPRSPYLNPAMAAAWLGISPRALQAHRSNGTGPRFRRHFRNIRYHIDDLDAWSRATARTSARRKGSTP